MPILVRVGIFGRDPGLDRALQWEPTEMYAALASIVDFVHALLMIAWVVGLPLLFWHRHRRAATYYAAYAVTFIVLSQGSHYLLGECFITTIARWLWERGGSPPHADPSEWFTVRFAMLIFKMAPSHKAITYVSEALILVTAVGVLVWMNRGRAERASARRRETGGGARPAGRVESLP